MLPLFTIFIALSESKWDYYCIENIKNSFCSEKHPNFETISASSISQIHLQKDSQNNAYVSLNQVSVNLDNFLTKKELIIDGNGKSTLHISTSSIMKNDMKVTLKNININCNSLNIVFKHLILENVTFTQNQISIKTGTFSCWDSKSLKSIKSVETETLELSIDETSEIQTFFTVIESKTKYSHDVPQIYIKSSVNCDLIFGIKYIEFQYQQLLSNINSTLKIFSNAFPFIQIDVCESEINLMCHSNLSPNSLLTPVLSAFDSKINLYGSKWPTHPRKIGYHWEIDGFHDDNERKMWARLITNSNISIFGKNIPISIQSEENLLVFAESIDCGITGTIVVNSPNDEIKRKAKGRVKFHVNQISVYNGKVQTLRDFINQTQNAPNEIKMLNIRDKKISLILTKCTNTSCISSQTKMICKSIENYDDEFDNPVFLEENGTIDLNIYHNYNIVFRKLYQILNPPPLTNYYLTNGDYNYSAILDYALGILTNCLSNPLSVLQQLKSFSNVISSVNDFETSGYHNITIKRNDFLYSLFYNSLRMSKNLVCSKDLLDNNQWNVKFENYTMDKANPYLTFSHSNFDFKTFVEEIDEMNCLTTSIDGPDSAFEALIYAEDDRISSYTSFLDDAIFYFLGKRNLKNIKSSLYNSESKNIIIITTNDFPQPINLENIREDANVLIVGLSISLIENLVSFNGSYSDFNFTKYMPKMNIKHKKLESLGVIFGNIENSEINVNNFYSLLNTFTNPNIRINANNIVTDIDTFQSIKEIKKEDTKENPFENVILFPASLKPPSFRNIKELQFINDSWNLFFPNSSINVDYSLIKKKLYLMTDIDQQFIISAYTSHIKPINIGYDIGLDKNLSSFPSIPLLEKNERVNRDYEKGNPSTFDVSKIVSSKLLEYFNSNLTKVIRFEGDWGNVTYMDENHGKDTIYIKTYSSTLEIENLPSLINVFNDIDFLSQDLITFTRFPENIDIQKPLLINRHKTLSVPKNANLLFSNITFNSRGSSFDFIDLDQNKKEVNTKILKINSNSSTIIEKMIISETIECEPGSLLELRNSEIASKVNAKLYYEINSFPLLKITEKEGFPNEVNLIYRSIKSFSDDDIQFYSSIPHIFLQIHSNNNLCNSYLNKIKIASSDESFHKNSPNFILNLFCQFDSQEKMTEFSVNITENVTEGDINNEYDVGRDETLIIIVCSVIGCIVVIAVIAVVLVILVKRMKHIKEEVSHCVSEEEKDLDNFDQPLNP
ncbi:hypothetical protein TRFO_04516 [Tritrichomonas foetus]|uniref:Uncharacterized protein n=1 Tax=Tritrichomonas foetus TaxID=1144522 RepID=A0A1J4KDE4_9EUKA|nr:hypothetical protein TRFO_04516 [Tritrichomonas foetus]|eukprot:OHT09457.1 hypothetical protein TRFO_04516 [Tritrichomonas foetus]